MEPAREAEGREQAEAAAVDSEEAAAKGAAEGLEEAAAKAAAVGKGGVVALEAALRQGPEAIAFARTAVRKSRISWELLVMSRNAQSAALPWQGNNRADRQLAGRR